MEEQDSRHAIGIDTRVIVALAFGYHYQAQNQTQVRYQQQGGAYESPLFAHGAEDEVGILLGYKTQFGLRSLQEPLARELP